MPIRGENIPEWLQDMMHDVFFTLRDNDPMLRYPNAPAVHKELESKLRARGDEARMPSIRSIRVYLSKWRNDRKAPARDRDAPWSLGMSEGNDLPDDATGVLLTVWKHAMTQAYDAPFSIRIAKWVNKLRWSPEAGGTSQGEVGNLNKLYDLAVRYAARERRVYMVKDTAGMQTGFLDSAVMFTDAELNLATRLGYEFTDDDGIDHLGELSLISPDQALVIKAIINFEAGNDPMLKKYGAFVDSILNTFGEFEAQANVMFSMALKDMYTNAEQRKLTREQHHKGVLDMVVHLQKTYRAGNIAEWEPPFQEIRERYLGELA